MTLLLPGAVRLPTGIQAGAALACPPPTEVGEGTLRWGSVRRRVTRWWRPARPDLPGLGCRVSDEAVREIRSAWCRLLGRGEGLTPYGDDVVCGALVALRAAGHPAAGDLAAAIAASDLEARTTAPSAALLRAACHGYCVDELAAYLADLAAGRDSADSQSRLLAVGATSGAGLREGAERVLSSPPAGERAA